jgi:hypothetical protein
LAVINILIEKYISYDALLNLNHLWIQYIRELKGNQSSQLFAEHLLKADLHGSILTGDLHYLIYFNTV